MSTLIQDMLAVYGADIEFIRSRVGEYNIATGATDDIERRFFVLCAKVRQAKNRDGGKMVDEVVVLANGNSVQPGDRAIYRGTNYTVKSVEPVGLTDDYYSRVTMVA